MTISYAIPVCNEHEEIDRLLSVIFENFNEQDEIVILQDDGNTTTEVKDVLRIWEKNFFHEFGQNAFNNHEKALNGDFAAFKNYLNSLCRNDYIFQIDADEIPSIGLLGDNLKALLESNREVDLFIVPRKNEIEHDNEDEFLEYVSTMGWFYKDGLINWPDNQARIYRNSSDVHWVGKVHEQLKGIRTYSVLVAELPHEQVNEYYHLKHKKSFQRQKKQNKFYSTL